MNLDLQLMAAKAESAESFLKLLSNRNRLMILCVLMEDELSVSELNERIPLSQSALSQHLAALREAGMVTTRRQAQTIFYRLDDDRVKTVLSALYQSFCGEES
jgi:ArsR family transcriptional regulator, virulence genes transcriptional regulator